MAVKPSAFGVPITPAASTILVGETAAGTAGRFTAGALLNAAGPPQIIDVAAEYSVVADGSTNNSNALMIMQAALAGSGKPHYHLLFPAGQINYDNPRWIYGIKSVSLWCNGTSFLNTNTGGSSRLARPLYTGHLDEDQVLAYNGSDHFVATYLFNNATAGDTVLTLTTSGDSAAFAAGERIFLYHYDVQFGGYPKNARFYEWCEIASVGSGTLTLKEAIRHTYNNSVFDSPGTPGTIPACGKPRIIRLDRADWKWPELVEIHGGRWMMNTTSPVYCQMSIMGRNVLIDGAIFDSNMIISENENFVMRNSDLMGYLEADKLHQRAEFVNCRFGSVLNNGVGIGHMIFNDCKFVTHLVLSPRHIEIKNCHFTLKTPTTSFGILTPDPTFGSERIDVHNNVIVSDTVLPYLIDDGGVVSLTVDSVSGTSILLNDNTSLNKEHIPKLRVGTLIWKSDMSKFGRITALTHDGAGHFVVAGDWLAPGAAETWNYLAPQKISATGNVMRGVRDCYPYRSWAPHLYTEGIGGTWSFKLSGAVVGTVTNKPVYGYIQSIKVHVTRAYTGGGTAIIRIYEQPTNNFYVSHDAAQIGYTRANIEGHYESLVSGTLGVQIPKDLKWTNAQLYYHDGGGSAPTGTAAQQAAWSMEIELVSLA